MDNLNQGLPQNKRGVAFAFVGQEEKTGNTTAVLTAGYGLALQRFKVLMIDLTTKSRSHSHPSLIERCTGSNRSEPTEVMLNLDLCHCNPNSKTVKNLDAWLDEYDFVLFDVANDVPSTLKKWISKHVGPTRQIRTMIPRVNVDEGTEPFDLHMVAFLGANSNPKMVVSFPDLGRCTGALSDKLGIPVPFLHSAHFKADETEVMCMDFVRDEAIQALVSELVTRATGKEVSLNSFKFDDGFRLVSKHLKRKTMSSDIDGLNRAVYVLKSDD